MTILDYYNSLRNKLSLLYPRREADSIAKLYVSETLNISNTDFICNYNNNLSENTLTQLKSGEIRLLNSEPVQYVLGYSYFFDNKYIVNSSVLIPRQETELLVNHIINKYNKIRDLKIIDIGTGSGCIAISLAKNLENSTVYAIDNSADAIKTAKENAANNNANVVFKKHDILLRKKKPFEEKVDIIVSNPPYVTESEKIHILKNVKDYEPDGALFVSDDNPLIFYERILDIAKYYGNNNCKMFFEINEKFAQNIKIMSLSKGFSYCEIIKDLNSKDRIVEIG